jgi:phage shock protein A
MGIFDKFSRMIRSNINDLISRAENPEKMLNQIILDMRDQLAKAKREVAAAIADERKLRQQLEEEAKQAREWEQRAMLAVREGRDDLAKQALMRQAEHAERATSLEQTWRSQAGETEKLKVSLRALNEKIEEAKRKRNLLIAKQKRAQAQRRIHETMSGLSDASAFDAFNRMAEKIEESERRTAAVIELDESMQLPDMEKEFKQLEAAHGSVAMDDRLAALKQQMGMLGSGSAAKAEPKQLGTGNSNANANANAKPAKPPIVQEAVVEADDGKAESGGSRIADAELMAQFERLERESR